MERPLRDETAGTRGWASGAPLIVALHVVALLVVALNWKIGLALLSATVLALMCFRRPMVPAAVIVALLWVNGPLADFFPMKQYTAWKDVLLVVLTVAWAMRSIGLRRPIALNHPVTKPLLLVLIWYVAMCVMSPSPIHAVLGLKASIFYAVWFFILPDIVQSVNDVKLLLASIVFGSTCLGVYAVWAVQQPFGFFPPGRDGRLLPGGLVVHFGPSALFLPLGILFGLAAYRLYRPAVRYAILLGTLVGFVGLLATTARAPWAMALLAIIAMSVVGRRKALLASLLVVVVAAGALQTMLHMEVAERAASSFESGDVSRETREAEFLTVMLPFVEEHPFGAGVGSMSAKGSAGVWSGGAAVDLLLQKGFVHNGFMLVAIETGWAGVVLYVWLLGVALLSAYRSHVRAEDPRVKDIALGCLGVMVFYAGMHFFAPMLTSPLISTDIWVVFGLIALLPVLDPSAQPWSICRSLERGAASKPVARAA